MGFVLKGRMPGGGATATLILIHPSRVRAASDPTLIFIVANGGYLSWFDPQREVVQQLQYFTNQPIIKDLGSPTGGSLREFVDANTRQMKLSAVKPDTKVVERRAILEHTAEARGRLY